MTFVVSNFDFLQNIFFQSEYISGYAERRRYMTGLKASYGITMLFIDLLV